MSSSLGCDRSSDASGDRDVLHVGAQADSGDDRIVLEGVDPIVFTGGTGENDPIVRSKLCDGLGWAGVTGMTVDGDPAPSVAAGPGVTVRSLPSQEDEQIARRSRSVVAGSA